MTLTELIELALTLTLFAAIAIALSMLVINFIDARQERREYARREAQRRARGER